MKTRFTGEPIVLALRQAEAGAPVGEDLRALGVSEATFSVWNAARLANHLGSDPNRNDHV